MNGWDCEAGGVGNSFQEEDNLSANDNEAGAKASVHAGHFDCEDGIPDGADLFTTSHQEQVSSMAQGSSFTPSLQQTAASGSSSFNHAAFTPSRFPLNAFFAPVNPSDKLPSVAAADEDAHHQTVSSQLPASSISSGPFTTSNRAGKRRAQQPSPAPSNSPGTSSRSAATPSPTSEPPPLNIGGASSKKHRPNRAQSRGDFSNSSIAGLAATIARTAQEDRMANAALAERLAERAEKKAARSRAHQLELAK
eukprot:6203020-Pleurochrysis_carterae.AAC.1